MCTPEQQSAKNNRGMDFAFADVVGCWANFVDRGHCNAVKKNNGNKTTPSMLVRLVQGNAQRTLIIDPSTFDHNNPYGKSFLSSAGAKHVATASGLSEKDAACVLFSKRKGIKVPRGNCSKAKCPFCGEKY